jgi:hypothetical protein
MINRPTSRTLLGMAVFGAASLGSLASPAYSAGAFPCGTTTDCVEDIYDPVGDKVINIFALPPDSGTLSFTETLGVYTFGFTPDTPLTFAGDDIEYTITATGTQFLNTVTLDFDAVGDFNITKSIFDSQGGTLLTTLSADGASYDASALLTQTLFIIDNYSVDASGLPDSEISFLSNSFTQFTPPPPNGVPAPLPLFGAGAAFSFSRRLRRRTKQAYKLG